MRQMSSSAPLRWPDRSGKKSRVRTADEVHLAVSAPSEVAAIFLSDLLPMLRPEGGITPGMPGESAAWCRENSRPRPTTSASCPRPIRFSGISALKKVAVIVGMRLDCFSSVTTRDIRAGLPIGETLVRLGDLPDERDVFAGFRRISVVAQDGHAVGVSRG